MNNSLYQCKEQAIRLEVYGNEMDNGYNLYYLNRTFSNLQGILDKAYLTYYTDKSKISEKDRKTFQIKILPFEEGSLITTILIFLMAANQSTFSFSVPFTPKFIWILFKQAYEYLTFVLDALNKNQPIQTYEGNNGMNLVVNGNNAQIMVFPQAQELARSAIEEIYSLANTIDEQGSIREIRISDNNMADSSPVIFNKKTKNLFKLKKRLIEQPTQIDVQIFRLDGHSLTGKLRVIDSNDPQIIPGNEYNFTIAENYILESCKEAFMDKATITVLKEMVFNPSDLNEVLSRLKVISVVE